MSRSRRFRRLCVPKVRREAGYAVLEAMPPLIACGFLGTVIAAGLMIRPPALADDAGGVHRTTQASAASTLEDVADGVQERPTPESAAVRYAYRTREYDDRLRALGSRSAAPFHGVPGSDYNGDGVEDLLISKPRATNLVDGTDPTGGFGSVEVWYKWSAAAELTLTAPVQNDLFGISAKSAGDLDGDGADDIVVGAMLDHGDSGLEGAVHVYSGSDGALLLSIIGEEWEYLGRTVAGASDVDGDGQWDIAAASWVYEDLRAKGMVSLLDGSDGSLIRTFTSDLFNDGFGYEIMGLGDLDGDGRSEIAVSASLAPGHPFAYAAATGRLHVFDGMPRGSEPEHFEVSDAALTIYNPDPLIDHFAVAVERTSDRDSDGVEDLLVTSLIDPYDQSLRTTAIQVFSSVTGDLLWPVHAAAPGSGREDESLPAVDENGEIIHYAHVVSALGVFGDTTRDLKVETEDLVLVANRMGQPAEPGNPVSGDLSLSGGVDVTDLNIVVGSMSDASVILDFVAEPSRLMGRWSSLDPYQYGDYVTGEAGRDGGGAGRDGEPSESDPVFPWPDPYFPGVYVTASAAGNGTASDPCQKFINHPGCGSAAACAWACCGQPGCGPTDPASGGGGDGSGGDANGNGIPDGVDCAAGGVPLRTSVCPNPCGDDDGDGIPNQMDCDSPCRDPRYAPVGAGGVACDPCGDDDCDGIANQNDCDSSCYAGDLEEDCGCQDDDGDGVRNQNDSDSPCFEAGRPFDLDIDSDNDDGIDVPSRSEDEDEAEDDDEANNKLIPVNDIDADRDGIVDYADGFNRNGTDGDGDDAIDPEDGDGVGFIPLVLQLGVAESCAEGLSISINYPASDPGLVDFDANGNPLLPAGGMIRVWTKDAMQSRSARSVSDEDEPGDYVAPGVHPVESFEFDGQGVAILYVEAVRIDDLGPSVPITAALVDGGRAVIAADAVRVRTFVLESVIFDELTGSVEPAPVILEPADLQPELWLTSVTAELINYSTMEITVEGVVRDRLSELTLNPQQQLESLQFYVEGHHVHTLDGLPGLTVTTPIAPWQLATLEVPFSETFLYQAPTGHFGAGGVPIDVMTSINAAGQNNRVSTFVGVNWLDLDWITGESLSPLPGFVGGRTPLALEFPDRVGSEPGTNAAISLSYNGTTAGATLSVGAGGLGTYEGDFTVLGMTTDIAFSAVGDRLLDPDEPDVLIFDAAYSDLDGEPRTHRLVFTETGHDTAQFVQELLREFELSFSGSTSTTGDTASVRYVGGGGPWTDLLEPDGVFDSPSLHGDPAQLGYNGEDLRLDIGADTVLNPSAPDVLDAPLVLSSGAGEVAIATQWVETGANTRIFRASSGGLINHPDRIPWAIRNTPYESGGFIPVIGYLPEFTEPDEDSFPSLNRIVKRISGLGDNVDPSILGIGDGFEVAPVEARAYSEHRSDHYRYYSVRVEGNRVVVYFFSVKNLPPGLDEARLRTGFDEDIHKSFAEISKDQWLSKEYGLIFSRAYAEHLGGLAVAPPSSDEQGEITLESIYIWYEFLLNENSGKYSNAAIGLLANYQSNGGVVILEELDRSIESGLQVNRKWEIDFPGDGRSHVHVIRIDPNRIDDPAEAAKILYESLLKLHEKGHFFEALNNNNETLFKAYRQTLKERWNRVFRTASAGANLYLAGVALFFEPVDWVLTINDLLEGEVGWEAAVNFLPFASAALNRSGRPYIKLCTSGSRKISVPCNGFSFSESASKKASEAKKAIKSHEALEIIRPFMRHMNLKERENVVKYLVFDGEKAPRDKKRLRNELLDATSDSGDGYIAHHILNNANKERFAVWGFDVDDYRNGQGVLIRADAHRGRPGWHIAIDEEWGQLLTSLEEAEPEVSWSEGRAAIIAFRDGPARQAVVRLSGEYDVPDGGQPIAKWADD